MSEEKKTPEIIFPPLPETKRGYSVQISASKVGNKLAYCNGRFVYLRNLEDPGVTIFTKHLHKVNAATISPNGNWVASGDETGQVYVWDVARPDITKNELKACRKVNCICWSFDSKRVCAAGDGNPNRAKVFPYDSSNSCGVVNGHTEQIIACDWNGKRPFRLATSGEDRCVAVYENVPVKINHDFEGEDHVKYCNSLKYSPDSSMLATAGADSKIFIYDGKKPDEPLKKMGGKKKGHMGSSIYSLVWSPDSKMLATGGGDKSVCIWDVETKKVVKRFVAGEGSHEFFQVGVVWLEKFLISVSLNGSLILWDFDSEKAIKRLCGHNSEVSDIALLDGTVYSCGQSSRLTKWDMKTGEGTWYEGKGHSEKCITGMEVTKSKQLATVGLDDSLRLTDASGSDFSDKPIPVGGYPNGLATAKSSDLIAVFVAQGKVTMVQDGKVSSTTEVDYVPKCGSFSSDDALLAVGDAKGKTHFYKVEGGKLSPSDFSMSGEHYGEVRGVSFSPDGKLVATAGAKKQIFISSTSGDGSSLNRFAWEYHQAGINCIAFSPKSDKLATGSMDQSIIIWKDLDKFDAKNRETIDAHTVGTVNIAWLDNDTLVSCGHDKCIKVWKV